MQNKLPERLWLLRHQQRGLTQNKLSELLGLSTKYRLGQFEQLRAIPTADELIKIARFFNVSIDYLVGLSDVYDGGVPNWKKE